MLKLLIVVLTVLIKITVPTVHAVTTDDIPGYIPPKRQKLTLEASKDYKMMIEHYAKKYSVEWQNLAYDMEFIIRCESNFNRYAINPHGEYSVGLSQINLHAHTNITKEQAEDPDFAIEFMAKHLSQDKYNMWYNCSQKLSTVK